MKITTATVGLPPEIDVTNAELLCADLCARAGSGIRTLVADMTATTFCDSAGFGMLLVVHDRLAEQAVQLHVLVAADGPVMRALRLIGFDQILRVSPVPGPQNTAAQLCPSESGGQAGR
jgi:anti-sigma B factor antagonist